MRSDQRIVTKIPLEELWDDTGTLAAQRIRSLDQKGIAELLRVGQVQFVVANCGAKLAWPNSSQRFDLWKSVRVHIADAHKKLRPSEFPNEVAYIASEWRLRNGDCLVLLEAYH